MDAIEAFEQVSLDTFIGQQNIIETIKISIAAAKMRNERLGHILLVGEKGSGKSTIAQAIGYKLSTDLRIVTSKELFKTGEIAAVLTSLQEGSLLIIEGFDLLPHDCLEILYTAMKKFYIEMKIGKGLSAKSVRFDLPVFTIIGTADSHRGLSAKIKECFYLDFVLNDYTKEELVMLAQKWCYSNNIHITDIAAEKIAVFAKGSNKNLTCTLKRARDFAEIINNNKIDCSVAEKTIIELRNNKFI